MATEFKNLLRKVSQQLDKYDVETLVVAARLPSQMKEQSAESVLIKIGGNGDLSVANLDAVIDALRQIPRKPDLYKEVKAFKKKSRKKLMDGSGQHPAPPPANSCCENNFSAAEREASQLLNTLEKLEGAEVVVGVDRIKELHSEAKELAENLFRVIRRANVLSRSYQPSAAGSDPHNSPPSLTSSTECPDVVAEASPPGPSSGGFRERITRRLQGSNKSKLSKKERTPSPKSQRKINRSQSEVVSVATKTPPASTPFRRLSSPPRATEPAGSDSEDDYHEYTKPDWPVGQTLPQQVPQRRHAQTLPRAPVSSGNSFGSRDVVVPGIPRKNSKNGPDQTPLPPQEPPPQDSDSDLEYDDVIGVLDMHNSERMGVITPRSKPQSLHPDGLTRGGHFPPSPTCSTPSSEVASPPAVLPKPIGKTKGAVPNITPAIPIRRSSLKSGQQHATTAPTASSHPNSLQSSVQQPSRSETTTPNHPIVDIQQAMRLKQRTGSPQSFGSSVGGTSDRVSLHPVSLAKALEMSSNQGFTSDCNDSCNCTGDSGFDEFTPISTAWHKTVVPPRPKPKTIKQHSMEQQQQSYTNIPIVSPTYPPSPPHHTSISHLAPIYGSNHTTPSPPSSSDHTTISAVAPMYNAITIEEQTDSGPEDDNCPDYVNVKQYVEPT